MDDERKPEHIEHCTEEKVETIDRKKDIANISTFSTKLSTDQLIFKTPHDSPSISVKSVKMKNGQSGDKQRVVLYLGILHFILGFMMVAFGILVIMHRVSLSQLGGGIWGGCLAMSTGVAGILTSAGGLCPLKTTPQKIAYTVFLALSLISLAISQLIVVISATGLARDINSADAEVEKLEAESSPHPDKITIDIPQNYLGLLFNIALIIVASLECICAALASYRSSRDLCPCFRRSEENYKENINIHRSHAIVSSWLGKHSVPPPIYVVTGPPSSVGGSKLPGVSLTPIYALPPPSMVQPHVIGYPLIPAPLGQVPSPIIPPSPPRREIAHRVHKRYRSKSKSKSRERELPTRHSRPKSKSRERQITDEDLARTYTGLDKTMAEEFIDMCDSRNNSLCSDYTSSCNSSCQSPCTTGCSSSGCNSSRCNSNSDAASHEFLVNKV